MFESTLAAKPRSKYRGLFAFASVVAHFVVGGLVLIASLWEIQEVNRPSRGIAMAHSLGLAPPSGGGEARAEPKRLKKPKPERKIIRDSRQPSQADKAVDPNPSSEGGDGTGEGEGTGEGSGGPGPGGDGVGTGLGIGMDLCLDPDVCAPPPVPVAAAPEPPQHVPQAIIGSLRRTAGEAQIQPPTSTRNAMARSSETQLSAIMLMCLDERGAVNKQRMVRSSGYADYDAKLMSGVRRWRYEPFRANGKPVAICSQLTFVYKQQ